MPLPAALGIHAKSMPLVLYGVAPWSRAGLAGYTAAMRKLAVILAVLLSVLPGQRASAAGLMPHRATYAVALKSVDPASDVADVRGQSTLTWARSCEAVTLTEQAVMTMTYETGEAISHHLARTTTESLDGRSFRFDQLALEDGAMVHHYVGEAVRQGARWEVRFTKPESLGRRLLPNDVVFPGGLLGREMAALGLLDTPLVASVLFEGGDDGGVHDITSVMGRLAPVQVMPRHVLLEQGARVVARAYHLRGVDDTAPGHEMIMHLHPSGVVSRFEHDFGRFQLALTLERLEGLPLPACEISAGAP